MTRGYVLAQEVRVGDVLHFLGRDRLVTSIESYPGVPGILPTGRIAYSGDWAMVLHDGLTTWVEVTSMADPLPSRAADVPPASGSRGERPGTREPGRQSAA